MDRIFTKRALASSKCHWDQELWPGSEGKRTFCRDERESHASWVPALFFYPRSLNGLHKRSITNLDQVRQGQKKPIELVAGIRSNSSTGLVDGPSILIELDASQAPLSGAYKLGNCPGKIGSLRRGLTFQFKASLSVYVCLNESCPLTIALQQQELRDQ